jgi:hypothetical protein
MDAIQPTLGTLVDAYLAWDALEEEIVHDLAAAGLHAREDLLPALLERLPKETGIKTVEELETVLYDESVFAELRDEVDPELMGAALCKLISSQEMTFAIPIARAAALARQSREQDAVAAEPVLVDIGGRNGLLLSHEQIAGVELACVSGSARVGHWRAAVREALVIAEEVSGVLMALGLLRLPPSHERDNSDLHVFRELGATVQYCHEGKNQTQAWLLPPSVQHSISQCALGIPRRLNDLERAKLAQGAPGALDHRFSMFLRPFVTGGVEASRVRRAARFLRKGATSDTPAESFLFMATSLESLLIPEGGDRLEKRISEAVAFMLGGSHSSRLRLRAVAETLYGVRSRYIHVGDYTGTESKRLEALRLVGDVVAHEIRMLAAPYDEEGEPEARTECDR